MKSVNEVNSSLKHKTSIFLFFLIIISFPISDKIFLFLRLQDFFVLTFIFLNITLLKKIEIKFLLIIFLILSITNLIGYIYFENFYIEKLAIIYKIIIPIIFLFQIEKILNKENYLKIEKYIDLTFIVFLSILFFGYEYNLTIIDLPILPGTLTISDQYNNDRHLVSLMVCIYFSLKFIINMKLKNYFNNFILLLIFFTMMNLFESRIFTIFLSTLVYLQLNELLIFNKFKKIWQILFYFLFFLFFLFIISKDTQSLRYLQFYELNIFKYILDYQIADVGPHANRIISFYLILPENLFLLFSGIGFIHYPFPFLDNGIIFFITAFGIFPLIYIINYFNKNLKYFSNIDFSLSMIFIVALLINLIVAEFFLVSRFIFVTLIMIKISSIKSKLLFSKNISNN